MSDVKRQTRSRPATLAKRNEILKAATEIFGSKGFVNGTLADIAQQVGMTHAGVLHHFGSKDHLLLEVLQYRDTADVQDLETKHIPDGEAFFQHLMRTAALNAERAGIVQAYVVLSGESVTEDHPARDYFQVRYRTLRSEAVAAFRAMCAEAGIDAPQAVEDAAAGVLAVMDGMQVQWLLSPESVDLARASGFAIQAIVDNVLGTAKSRDATDATTEPADGVDTAETPDTPDTAAKLSATADLTDPV